MTDTSKAGARYLVTRYRPDPRVPARYRRAGWGAFDTQHPTAAVVLWPTRAEAAREAARLNGTERQAPSSAPEGGEQ